MGRDETKSIAISMVNGTMYYDVGVVVGVGVGVGVEGIDRVSRCLLAVVLCVFFCGPFACLSFLSRSHSTALAL